MDPALVAAATLCLVIIVYLVWSLLAPERF
jgi:hypothetical protein